MHLSNRITMTSSLSDDEHIEEQPSSYSDDKSETLVAVELEKRKSQGPRCCQLKPEDPLSCPGKEEEGKSHGSIICKEEAIRKESFVHDESC
jgi:hypothetical protein